MIWNPSNYECECYKSLSAKKKRLVKKFVEECNENVVETRLVEINTTECKAVETKCKHNVQCAALAHCTLCYFQYSLQLTLELVFIFFVFIGT